MENHLIYPINEIDNVIINFLGIGNLLKISQVNKYYYYNCSSKYISTNIIIKEIRSYNKKYKINPLKENKIFYESCRNGWINLAKYIWQNYSIHKQAFDNAIFYCCKNGQYEIIEWLSTKQNCYCGSNICRFEWTLTYF